MQSRAERISFLVTLDDASQEVAVRAAQEFLDRTEFEEGAKLPWVGLGEGLAIYRKSGSPYWYVWIRLPTTSPPAARRSTKKRDRQEATQAAYMIQARILTEQSLGGHRISAPAKMWTDVCKEVVADLRKAARVSMKAGNNRPQEQVKASIIESRLQDHPKLAKLKFSSVGLPELSVLVKDPNFSNMSKTVARNTKRAIEDILHHGVVQRYIVESSKPSVPAFKGEVKKDDNKPFDVDDRAAFLNHFQEFVDAGIKKITKQRRSQFALYFNLLCGTGLRCGEEPLGIEWKDIKSGMFDAEDGTKKKIYYCDVNKGKMKKTTILNGRKTTKSREIILDWNATQTIEQLYKQDFGVKRSIDEIATRNDVGYVFMRHKGKKPNFAETFDQYHEFLGDKLKERYTLYSCRHEYMNVSMDKGISQSDVAEQCGTSVATIDKYYKSFKAINRASRLLSEDDIKKFNMPSSAPDARGGSTVFAVTETN